MKKATIPPPLCLVPALLVFLPMALSVAAEGGTSCQDRLAEVDASIAAADVAPQMRATLKSFRDRAAEQCAAGREASALAALQPVEMLLQQNAQAGAKKATAAAEKEASREQLTPDYLEGEWCATQKQNNERGLYVFSADGTYRVGPAEYNYGLVSGGDMKDFWETYDAVTSKESDKFVVTRYSYVTVFRRGQGACQPTAPRP